MSKLFVIAGPSGIGKSYLMQQLQSRYPDKFVIPKLLSTRAPRPGEQAIDRQFISQKQFASRVVRDEFVWHDIFYGNRYGYTHEAVQPKDKHTLINALPPMVEQFATLPEVVMLGLTVAPENFGLIEQRLRIRGDPPEAVRKRLDALEKDVQLMAATKASILQHGKLFEISDDTSAQEVIDWLVYTYIRDAND